MQNKKTQKSIQGLAISAMFSAIICVVAPWSIFTTSLVPLSLASFVLYLCAVLLPPSRATLSTLVFILLGAVGLPVFSGFSGGIAKILGPTGGYIIGYLPMVFIIAILIKAVPKKFMYPIAMVIGTAVLYALGTAWFMYQQQIGLVAALSSCVIPFLLADSIKIIAVTAIGIPLKKRLAKFMW